MAELDTSGSGAVLSTMYRNEFEPDVRMLTKKKSIFQQRNWFGKGSNSPIVICDNFKGGEKAGTRIVVDFAKPVNQLPVSGATTINGTAAPITHYQSYIDLHQHRLLLRSEGRMDEQHRIHKLRKEWVPQFGQYGASLIDALMIRACYTGATTITSELLASGEILGTLANNWTDGWQSGVYTSAHRVVYGGTATSFASIAQGDVFNVTTARRLAAGCRQAGRGTINIDGYEIVGVCILSPGQVYTLKDDARWSEAQLLMPQNTSNPFFTGALFNIDGVMFYPDLRNPDAIGVFADSSKGSRGSLLFHSMADPSYDKVEAICLSAQALAYAPHTESAIDPYEITEGNEFPGDIWRTMIGFGKIQYNRGTDSSATVVDVGVTYVATAAPNNLAAIGA